jgi:formylglycine-generating enzyme required for sulfatase activity
MISLKSPHLQALLLPATVLMTVLFAGCAPAAETVPSGLGESSPTITPTPVVPAFSTTPALGLGSTRISPADDMTMVLVPAGSFPMGSAVGLTDEQPVHTVYLDAFWLDRTEVTNVQYRRCLGAGACQPPAPTTYFDDPNYGDHPVVFVSWNKAQDYCAWAGRRLPTEAEWEKAATWNPVTNEKYTYPWGNTFDCRKGNFDDETTYDAAMMPGSYENCDGFPNTAPVGSFPTGASPYGALDMAGNVWEWVHDAFIEVDPLTPSIKNYYAISPPANPQGVDPKLSAYRVIRGGSWNWTFGSGRAAYRLWYGLDDSYDAVGFRCAQSQ